MPVSLMCCLPTDIQRCRVMSASSSAKAEYDYYDFSTRNLTLPGTIFGIPEVVPGVNVKETTVKFGINYRFGTY